MSRRAVMGAATILLMFAMLPASVSAQRESGGNAAPDVLAARISPVPFPDALLGGGEFVPEAPTMRPELAPAQRRAWFVLGIAQHGAAFFDAYTTREAMTHHRELDPLMRPFAHSAAVYPAMQIAPLGLDWLGGRLATSRHRWLRRIWWLPQAAATAGFVWSGTHNLHLSSDPPAVTR